MKNFKRNESGFTLIELIVVMIIIGILVLLATPRFIRYIKDANATALTVDVKVLKDAALYTNLKAYEEAGRETGYPVSNADAGKTLADIETLDGVDKDVWKKAVEETLEGALGEGNVKALTEYKVANLDPEQLRSHIRNTKYDVKDFVVILDGDAEGEVFYTGIVEDGDKLPHVGLTAPTTAVDEPVATTPGA